MPKTDKRTKMMDILGSLQSEDIEDITLEYGKWPDDKYAVNAVKITFSHKIYFGPKT